MRSTPWLLGVVVAMTFSTSTLAAEMTPEAHREAVEAWYAGRIERLTAADGWLSLVGLHWVEPGVHTLGIADDNDIVLATGPQHLGKVSLLDGQLSLAPDSASGVVAHVGETTRVEIVPGKSSIELMQRGERYVLRVRDADAITRTQFTSIDRFPVDMNWRVKARFEAHPAGTTMEIANVTGSLDTTANPGVLHFELDGEPFALEALEGSETQLFLIIADRTSGRDTYGAGRFIYIDNPVDGVAVIDFNQAYNPPCVFTAFSTCPLPPPENRLDIAVTAGEKRYVSAER